MKNSIHKHIQESLKLAKYVTTTTEIFKKEIQKLNKKVFFFYNCIDPNEEQFNEKTTDSDRIRFGWLGGSSHLHDIKMLNEISTLSNFKDQYGFVLCGFDTRGTVTEIDSQTGQERTRDIEPLETVWYEYEKIVTNNYKYVSEDHKNYLMKFIPEEYKGNDRHIKEFDFTSNKLAKNYSKFDVSLVPN